MFVNTKTGRPAYLISHDGDVVFSDAADLGRPHHTVASHEFFGAHREATADELAGERPKRQAAAPAAPKAARKPRKSSSSKAAASTPPPASSPPPPPAAES